MKKKVLLFASIVLISLFTVTVHAERKDSFPITIIDNSYSKVYAARINSFEVTNVVHLPDKNLIRIECDIDYTKISGYGNLYMCVKCYDSAGYLIKIVEMDNTLFVLVPDNTATFELTTKTPTSESQSYLYGRYLNIYAPDGRSMQITDLQLPLYEAAGWTRYYSNVETTTSLPVELSHNTGYSDDYITRINSFEVTEITKSPLEYSNRIRYNISYENITGNGSLYMVMRCYNGTGSLIKTLTFNPASELIDVPDTTAVIEIGMKNPAPGSQRFFYCEKTTVYAPDGRSMAITDLQLPAYKAVGWSSAVSMFSLDGRSISVPPIDVPLYEQVGWYTADGLVYREIQLLYADYKAKKEYNKIIELAETGLRTLTGTKYEASLYVMRTEAIDLWRNSSGAPLGVIGYSIGENSIGVPKVSIEFRNISYKKIVAFKLKFTCYDIFGDLEESYYDSFYTDSANLDVAKSRPYTWTLYGAESVNRIENIHLTEVVFEDGTKW